MSGTHSVCVRVFERKVRFIGQVYRSAGVKCLKMVFGVNIFNLIEHVAGPLVLVALAATVREP